MAGRPSPRFRPSQMRGISADIPELKSFLKDLRKIEPETAKAVRRNLRRLAKKVSDDARRRAAKRTRRLERSISPSVTSRGASIVVKAPHARMNEFGGRHPVFGNEDVWVNQKPMPFLFPAVAAGKEQFFKEADAALIEAARRARFS
jgi:HK97 gp10 family phage protein